MGLGSALKGLGGAIGAVPGVAPVGKTLGLPAGGGMAAPGPALSPGVNTGAVGTLAKQGLAGKKFSAARSMRGRRR